jgi:hypothetical protein
MDCVQITTLSSFFSSAAIGSTVTKSSCVGSALGEVSELGNAVASLLGGNSSLLLLLFASTRKGPDLI